MAKSPKRKDYLKEYKQGESGKYEYGGISYTFDGTPEERKKQVTKILVIAIIIIVLILLVLLSLFAESIKSFNT